MRPTANAVGVAVLDKVSRGVPALVLAALAVLSHGGVPQLLLEVDDLSAYNVGYLIYFFWRAVACSGYLLGVNPFNQPGVESYKKNMFALLGKPGYENLTAELEAKLK